MEETAWHSGWNEAARFRQSGRYFWIVEVLGAALFVALIAYFLLPDNPTRTEAAIYPSVGLLIGFGASYVLIVAWCCARAPIMQRNEARGLLRQYLNRKIRFDRAYLLDGRLFVSMTNMGDTDSFSAQIVRLEGLQSDAWANPPWQVPWKGLENDVATTIMHGSEGVLDIGGVHGPAFIPEISIKENRVHYGTLMIKIVGDEHNRFLSSGQKGTFEEAMQETFGMVLRVSAISLQAPAETRIEICFPSSRPAKWNNGRVEGEVDVRLVATLAASADTALTPTPSAVINQTRKLC